MLHALELTNYKRHRRMYAEFGAGLNAICGPNWSGKTTLHQAILYALFGARAVAGRAEQLVTHGEKAMSVRLDFSVGSERFSIERTATSAALRRCDGTLLATGHSAVTAEVEERLGTPAKDFLAFNRIRARDAAAVLTLGSAKLGEYIDRVSGVDLVDRVVGRCKEAQGQAESVLSELEPQLERPEQLTQRQALSETLRARIASLGKEQDDLRASEVECTEQLHRSQSELERLRARHRAFERRQLAFELAQQALQEAQRDLHREETSPATAPLVSAEQCCQRFERLRADLATWNAHATELESARQTERVARETLARFPNPLPQIADTQAQECAKREAEQAFVGAFGAFQQAQAALAGTCCPACKRPFDGADVPRLEAELEISRERLLSCERQREQAIQALVKAQSAADSAKQIHQGHQAWSEHLGRTEQTLERLLAAAPEPVEPSHVEQARLAWQSALNDEQICRAWSERCERERGRVARLQATLDELERDRTEEAAIDPGAVSDMEQAVQQYRETLGKLQLRLRDAEHAKAMAVGELAACDACFDEQTRLNARCEQLRQHRHRCMQLAKFLRDNRDRYTAAVWDRLLGYASEFVAAATAGAVTALVRRPSGGFGFVEDGLEREVEGEASDLQEAIFGVAIRLAMGDALGGPFSTMLLDEVTAPARDEMSLLFVGQLKRLDRQILLITHRSADAAEADRLIELE